MKKWSAIFILIFFALLLSSCANSGSFFSSNVTSVELGEKNYQIIAKNISGTSSVGYVLGASYSIGGMSQCGGVYRVSGTGEIYKEALEDLWKNFEADYGAMQGESIALANVRYDADLLNLFIYAQLELTVRADVVKFIK